MRVKAGFTGTRRGMTPRQQSLLRYILTIYGVTTLHHGDAIGADAEACEIAQDLNIATVAHPCNIPAQRAFTTGNVSSWDVKPPLDRNHDIVDAADLMIAMPDGPERLRSGTWATVRYARSHQFTAGLIIIEPGMERL